LERTVESEAFIRRNEQNKKTERSEVFCFIKTGNKGTGVAESWGFKMNKNKIKTEQLRGFCFIKAGNKGTGVAESFGKAKEIFLPQSG